MFLMYYKLFYIYQGRSILVVFSVTRPVVHISDNIIDISMCLNSL